MDAHSIIRTFGALLAVLGLMAGLLILLRRFGKKFPDLAQFSNTKTKRLFIIETKVIDARHRLALISRDGIEHLLVLSTDGALIVETEINLNDQ